MANNQKTEDLESNNLPSTPIEETKKQPAQDLSNEDLSVQSVSDLVNVQLDRAKEKKLLVALDLHFVPIIMFAYLTCFLDRGNIGTSSPSLSWKKKMVLTDMTVGNVKVAGMPEDIGATNAQYSTAVSIFYATYVTFETPLAMLMKKITPRNLLCGLCVVWSLTTIFTGFVTSVGGLYASRLVLGCCEAGLFPCLNLYISMVYRREEQAKRVSYLMSCAALSGAVGGLLAYGLLQMDGVAGKAGWRYTLLPL